MRRPRPLGVAYDADGRARLAHHAAFDAQSASHACVLHDGGREHRVDGVSFAHAVVDDDGLVDEGARAIAHLAAHALKRDAQILVNDRDPHSHVLAPVDVAQRAGGAGFDAGEVLAQAARLLARVDAGRADGDARALRSGGERAVGARLDALAAFDAARQEVPLALGAGRAQQVGLAPQRVRGGLEGHDSRRCACDDVRQLHGASPFPHKKIMRPRAPRAYRGAPAIRVGKNPVRREGFYLFPTKNDFDQVDQPWNPVGEFRGFDARERSCGIRLSSNSGASDAHCVCRGPAAALSSAPIAFCGKAGRTGRRRGFAARLARMRTPRCVQRRRRGVWSAGEFGMPSIGFGRVGTESGEPSKRSVGCPRRRRCRAGRRCRTPRTGRWPTRARCRWSRRRPPCPS